MSNCLINFAKGAWYPQGQQRLLRSLKDTGFTGEILTWTDEAQLNCPPHTALPYAFKIAAFQEAYAHGYRRILWCDAAVWADKPVEPAFKHLEQHGHLLFSGIPVGTDNCAQWTSDRCLAAMGVSRAEAKTMPMYMACCMGLDLSQERPCEFLKRLSGYTSPDCLLGDWNNDRQQVSIDPECRGHRHDQSVGSILAAQLDMKHTDGAETYFMYYNNPARTPFVYGHKNDMTGINDSVVLLSQGM